MPDYPSTPTQARTLANAAAEAIRALNHATLPADGSPALEHASDAYDMLAALAQLAQRLPQLLEQVSAYLQRQLQHDRIAVTGGPFVGDPFGAVGTASDQLENAATQAACALAVALDTAQQAIAFASHAGGDPDAVSWHWASPLLAFAGAALGAGLTYLGARTGIGQRERQARREEWGRRFTAALDAVGSPEPQRRQLGLLLLGKLARSDLATSEERQLADDLLTETARYDPHGADLRLIQPGPELDDIRLIEQDRDDGPASNEEHRP